HLDAMASIANAVALGIERKQVEEERVRLWVLAQQARSEAEDALQVRNDFLSSVSHDLKTPLTVMKGTLQILQRRLKRTASVDPLWALERLKIQEASITKMHGMIEDLLTIAQVQAGQHLDLDLRPLSLFPIIERVVTEQQETTNRHHLCITTFSKDLQVRGDPIRLDRVVTNLLANAIKYSPDGGPITLDIRAEREQDQTWIVMRFQDEGVGVPEADQPFLFDAFYRASNVRKEIPGTGVGLASAAQVVHEHGGTISIISQEGQGTCILVRLPATIEPDTSSPKPERKEHI
nr:HAMP domain-containing histidine kinase [Ktedonobacteraceae bacterium]